MGKRTVALDADEVLFQFNIPLLPWLYQKHGIFLKYEDIKYYSLAKVLGISEQEAISLIYGFYDTDEFKNLKPINGAVEGVQQLSNNYISLIYTARPLDVRDITIKNAAYLFSNFIEGIHFTNEFSNNSAQSTTKRELGLEHNILAIVEDRASTAIDCSKGTNIWALLLAKPWNITAKLPYNVLRVDDWLGRYGIVDTIQNLPTFENKVLRFIWSYSYRFSKLFNLQ